jgi:hypothetical protein
MANTQNLVRWFKSCQFFTKQQHVLAQVPRTILPSWPFAIWGLDLVGPFKMAPGGYKHILVAMDKFTKWIEVRAVAMVTSKDVAKFIKDITHRFGYPTGSSPTWARLLQGRTSGVFARTVSSMSTTPQWPTHGATARSSGQTAWCFKLSKTTLR